MSPLNRGPLMGPRIPPTAMRPPMHRYGRAPPPPPGMARGMLPPPMNPMFGPPRGRPMPPMPLRPGPMMARPGPLPPCPPMFGPRNRHMPPMPPMPPMGLRGPMGMRPGPRGMLPPHALPHMRPRFPPNHTNGKAKPNNTKKANKLEELELKKPWMTDEIRSEIQKKNKLYAKAKKNKDAKEWEEFKDLRNKVTRMIRDAKNEFLAKNPEQAHLYGNDEEIPEVTSEDVAEFFAMGSEDEESASPYCEVCDRDFDSEEKLQRHIQEHQICRIDGCTFTAHPKIVEKHISMQHVTGLYERMKNVMSDEDVTKWRAERKRRYPTAVTIKIREDEQIAKKKRGEVIQNEIESRKIQNTPKRDKRKPRKRKRNKPAQSRMPEKTVEHELYRGLLPFAGTAMLDENEQSDDSLVQDAIGVEVVEPEENRCKIVLSDEDEEAVQQIVPADFKKSEIAESPKPVVPASLTLSLVADYGSDSDDEPPEEVPIKKSKADDEEALKSPEPKLESTKITDKIATPIDTKITLSTSKYDRKSVAKEKNIYEDDKKSSTPRSTPRRHNNSQYSNGKLRLLNRLLARSIQHERNAIYQCITFIANNNFFD
ncbi:nuclear fragile X mental retardation-interacting protein 1 isoform X1 [Nasonia vitripennis]|uniref:C2H2-type domain-containing protein n=2 Tax=Nasonia vitripennis TaxID=7425 RepID=A0A7M7HH69_NASVI|nr:nuclear fragile X mental retardation-interacting protein 1 isoform X1 [Nasonia vitripennis]XP_008215704.1 nuclear fragile X mental retardation-interacting protein 1 isoform X1 [Nasonia vitripennis]